MDNVLIIGGSGFVGSYLVQHFKDSGYNVSWTGRNKGDYLVDFSVKNSYESVFGDATFDLVVCALNSYSTSLGDAISTNVAGVANILACFNGKCKHLIFISSLFADITNAHGSVYAFSKMLAEQVIQFQADIISSKTTILEFGQIFDCEGNARKSQKGLYYFVDSIKENKPITLFVKNEMKRTYMPIEVLCKLVEYVFVKGTCGKHVATIEPNLTLSELVEVLSRGSNYVETLVTKDSQKEAISYFIPKQSNELQPFLDGFNSRIYLEKLMNQ